MAIQIFPWGTVKDTPKGVLFRLARGVLLDMRRIPAATLSEYIGGRIPPSTCGWPPSQVPTALCVGDIRLSWDPHAFPTTAGSILKVGNLIMTSAGPDYHRFDTSRALALLSRDEAKELSGAISKILKATAASAAPNPKYMGFDEAVCFVS